MHLQNQKITTKTLWGHYCKTERWTLNRCKVAELQQGAPLTHHLCWFHHVPANQLLGPHQHPSQGHSLIRMATAMQQGWALLSIKQTNKQRVCLLVSFVWFHHKTTPWDNVWKSRGGIMVNLVPREDPRPKPKGFLPRDSRGIPFPMIHPRLFHTCPLFFHLGLPREYHGQCL